MKYAKPFIEGTTILLVILFLYTGVIKYMDNKDFVVVLKDSPLLAPVANLIGALLPGIEILLAVLLIVPKTKTLGLKLSAVLLAGFIVYLFYMVVFTPNLPCSCGGIISKLSWTGHIIFNTVCLAAALLSIRFMNRSNHDDSNMVYASQ